MPKRKRDSPSADKPEESAARVLKQRKKLFAQRLAAAQKPLLDALRHAATLERQKFSRRRKGAKTSNDNKASQRLEAEYAILKTLDLAKVAEQHLKKVIQRVKSLRECDALPESAKIAPGAGSGEKDVASLNVQARLFKVDGVRKIVDEVIEDLKIIVGAGKGGVDGEKMAKKQKEERDNKKAKREMVDDEESEEEEEEAEQEFDSDALAAFDARIAAPSSAEEDSDASLSDGHRPPSIADSENEDDAEDELLASDCDGDPTAFDRSQNEEEEEEEEEEASDSDSGAINDSAIDSESESDAIAIPVPKAKKKAVAAPPPISGNSTFVPSLSLAAAFYSGSESDASDIEGADVAPVRKNRRGQRARQKIWEKKYGEKAKHKEKEDRSKGWDAKKGAVGDKKGRKEKAYGPQKSGENAIPLGKKKETKRDDVGELHPSWAAAKKAKEMKSMIKIAKEGGGGAKKIVFD